MAAHGVDHERALLEDLHVQVRGAALLGHADEEQATQGHGRGEHLDRLAQPFAQDPVPQRLAELHDEPVLLAGGAHREEQVVDLLAEHGEQSAQSARVPGRGACRVDHEAGMAEPLASHVDGAGDHEPAGRGEGQLLAGLGGGPLEDLVELRDREPLGRGEGGEAQVVAEGADESAQGARLLDQDGKDEAQHVRNRASFLEAVFEDLVEHGAEVKGFGLWVHGDGRPGDGIIAPSSCRP